MCGRNVGLESRERCRVSMLSVENKRVQCVLIVKVVQSAQSVKEKSAVRVMGVE